MTTSTRQTAWCMAKREQELHVQGSRALTLPQRGGFTLVELLVVVGIITILAALITPAVFQARVSARNAAIKTEIDLLHVAMMHYKNEYGSFPPCSSPIGSGNPAALHVQRLFPRASTANTTPTNATTPENAIALWLAGYSKNPTDPLVDPKVKLFDFDQSRVTSSNQFHPAKKPGSPYIYVNSAQYFLTKTPTSYTLRPYVQLRITEDINGNGVLESFEDVNSNGVLDCEAFNPDTFQILCAGLDEIVHEDRNENGVLDPGEDFNLNGVLDTSDDDLSNFWKGTRGDQ